MFRPFQILSACAVIAACGGQIDTPSTGADASSDGSAGHDGVGVDADAGVWTECSSPQGYQICRGPKNCPDTCGCADHRFPSETGNAISFCINDPLVDFIAAHTRENNWKCNASCEGICARDMFDGIFSCVPYEIGVLYAQSGAADSVRYGDLGLWRNEPIPATAGACPTVPGMTLCGPGCGTCAANERCVGRAPLHPTGFCMPATGPSVTCAVATAQTDCPAWDKCFTFTVEPAAQAIADEYGYCVPTASCSTLATSLPGGGKCSP